MEMNDKLSIIAGGILITWWCLHISLEDIIKRIQSRLLFGEWKYNKFDMVHKFIYSKEFEEKDSKYITRLKVRLNVYIDKYKHNSKSSIDSTITIIISSLITITIAQYTMQSQAHRELITQIVKSLSNDFMTIFFVVIIIYGIRGILHEFAGSKFEYYLFVKNIIDEIENDKAKEVIAILRT